MLIKGEIMSEVTGMREPLYFLSLFSVNLKLL